MEKEKLTTPFGEIVHTEEPGNGDDMNDVWGFTLQMTEQWLDRRQQGLDDLADFIGRNRRKKNEE